MLDSSSESSRALGKIFYALCKSIDTPVSLGCWLRYKYGEHEQLARKKITPSAYCNWTAFRDDYLVVSYLSKNKELVTGVNVKAEALDAFTSAELQCRETNVRLRKGLVAHATVESYLTVATRKIGQILGELSVFDAMQDCKWGKGATATLTGAEATLVRKMDPGKGRISVTRRALKWMKIHLEADPHWFFALAKAEVAGPYSVVPPLVFEIVEGNKVTTVPKDATKDRTIAAEPTANIWLQLGVGRLLRKVLRMRAGIDLDDQSKNRRYAQLGSLSGAYATIDLKSASDTVSKELVKQLLPYEWFELLDQLRSPKGRIGKGDWFEYEKFSSMGNGFTFELETLIFYALSSAVVDDLGCKGRVLVYGDDIVVPTQAYAKVCEVLQYCGFTVNPEKSFAEGYFRESCGGHYWEGKDVTPLYQKEPLQYRRRKAEKLFVDKPEAYRCANRILRLAWRRGHEKWLASELYGVWMAARRSLDLLEIRHAVPLDSETDDGLALPHDEFIHHVEPVWHLGAERSYRCLVFIPRKSKDEFGSLLAYWLRQSDKRKEETPAGLGRQARWGFPAEFFSNFLKVSDTSSTEEVTLRRLGTYVSRRRAYRGGTPNVAWL